ncbi:hypothetical protein E4J89_04270 [Arthrobacter sp. CAU 1506]|uniref:DUF6226 family protein n=1 Tax=Arthrobacter sp. CAU 1506 TaxID=2560052 RepID=UPI0010AD5501|nr:DUF6226 family protein [Arthrobacter sp. CAU 1506]TJY71468.1 hypothetical protein E4J89_04270 [Arthrobacter sp. CAU 1506]
MAAAEDLFEGPATGPPLPVYSGRALYRSETDESEIRHVGGYAPFVGFCARLGEDAAGLAADPVRLLEFLRANAAALLADPDVANAAEVFTGNTVVAQRPDAQWRSMEGGVTEAGDHEMSLIVQGLVERLHSASVEQFAESLATVREWVESDPEPLPRFEEHDGNLPQPVPLPAGWKPYVRPDISVEVYRDADGTPLPYGTRWGDEAAASESYGVTSNTGRFSGLHAVADSLIDFLVSTYAASTRDVTAETEARMRGQVSVLRAVRVDPASPDAAPLVFTYTDFPGVLLHSGLLHSTPFPSCGCDACDEILDSEAAGLEQQVLSVAAGGFAERYPLGKHRRAEYQLVRVDGSGWEGGGGEPSHDYTEDQLLRAERTLELLPNGWQPWPLRQQ